MDDLVHLQVQTGVFVRKAFPEELLVESDAISIDMPIEDFD